MSTPATPRPGVVIHQPARGFRYSADVFLLGGFALEDGLPARALDLGTGSGVLPFLLAAAGVHAHGIDRLADWQPYWDQSLHDSAFAPTLAVQRVQDLQAGTFDLVTCNPPFSPAGTGPIPTDPLKAAAHVELDGVLVDFVQAAARACAPNGSVAFVVPVPRLAGLRRAFREAGLHVHRGLQVGERRVVLVGGPQAGAERDLEQLPARGDGVDALYARLLGTLTEAAPH